MSKHHRLAGVPISLLAAAACTHVGDVKPAPMACSALAPADKHQYTLMFQMRNDECVEKVIRRGGCDAEVLVVHPCDTVEWLVTGKKKQSVAFDDGGRKSPFTWTEEGSHSRIAGEVRADAPQKQILKYTVRTEGGCPLDPMIIVQPR
jgi:hypothetical protein